MRATSRHTLLAISAAVALWSCGGRPEQYGVVLWPIEEPPLEAGSVIPIYDSSQLNSTFALKKSAQQLEWVEQWKIAPSKREKDARSEAERFEPFRRQFGVSGLDGLAIRSEPDPEGDRVYKLRLGEAVKIIARGATMATVGEYEGYWYLVLTGNGTEGHVFSAYLEIRDVDELGSDQDIVEVDEFIERFFANNYRPDYYREMVRTGHFDLERFLPEYGIYPDRENRRITIVTEEHESVIEYESITRPTEDSYAFEGSTLILFVRPGWINLIYSETLDGGINRYSEDYVFFPDDIEMIAIRETHRREALFEEIRGVGSLLESSVYGTIELGDELSFMWSGFQRLVPEVIPAAATGAGRALFSLYLDDELVGRYDGAMLLEFDDAGLDPLERVAFLYAFGSGGIRLTHVPRSSIEENLVTEDTQSSTTLFFEYR